MQKTYLYKVYSPLYEYRGILSNVVSDFTYNQTIASTSVQIDIIVNQSPDTAFLPTSPILDELGNEVLDEQGNVITDEGSPTTIGDNSLQIDEDNIIKVYEISSDYPTGLLKFTGYISKWEAEFGGKDYIKITCISLGQDLAQYLVMSGDTVSVSQTSSDGSSYSIGSNGFDDFAVVQSFEVTSDITCDAISLQLATTESNVLNITISESLGGSAIAQGSGTLPVQSSTLTKISLDSPVSLVTGIAYYIFVEWSGAQNCTVTADSSNPYANGQVWSAQGTNYWNYTSEPNSDLYFVIWAYGNNTSGSYVSKDPSTILTSILENYQQQGGIVQAPISNFTPTIQMPLINTQQSGAYWGTAFAQIFTPVKTFNMNILQLYVGTSSGSETVTAQIVQGNPANDTASVTGGAYTYTLGSGNTVIATSDTLTVTNTVPYNQILTFSTPVNLVSGTQYYILMQWNQSGFGNLLFYGAGSGDGIGGYAGVGELYSSLATTNNAGANPTYKSGNPALCFGLGYMVDPSIYFRGGYPLTNLTTNYTFTAETTLAGIKAIFSLAPANWYWYIDPATNILYFDKYSTSADIMIIKGRHIDTLNLISTKENIVNVVYFTGGKDIAGNNIYVVVNGTRGNNRRGLKQLSDNRVNSVNLGGDSEAYATATLIAQNYIDNTANRTYNSTITIQGGTMDLNLLSLGAVLGFSGFGTFIDNLLLPIVSITPKPDSVTCTIGSLPKRISETVQQIFNQLNEIQTIANPDVPS